MTHITFVKKILGNGELCKKCLEVSARLESEGLMSSINHIAIADERDNESEGARLATQFSVTRAPFFIVEDESGNIEVYDVYFKFKKFMSEQGLGMTTKIAL